MLQRQMHEMRFLAYLVHLCDRADRRLTNIVNPKGHPSAPRYGFLRDLESSEPFLICSHFL